MSKDGVKEIGGVPFIALANHAQFRGGKGTYHSCVESRLCLWSRAGAGHVYVNGEKLVLWPNDYLVCPWGMRIRYCPDPSAPFFLGGIHLIPRCDMGNGALLDVAHGQRSPLRKSSYRGDADILDAVGVCRFNLSPASALLQLSEYTVSHYQGAQRDVQQLARLALDLINELRFAQEHGNHAKPNIPHGLRRLMQHVDERIASNLSSDEMAAIMGCSCSQMRRQFRHFAGMSPVEWINRKRIEKGRAILSSSRISVADVAERLGYADQFYFSRIFKKYSGESPRDYRSSRALI